MKKVLAMLLSLVMLASFAACGAKTDSGKDAEKTYNVGVVQLVQHDLIQHNSSDEVSGTSVLV